MTRESGDFEDLWPIEMITTDRLVSEAIYKRFYQAEILGYMGMPLDSVKPELIIMDVQNALLGRADEITRAAEMHEDMTMELAFEKYAELVKDKETNFYI